MFDFHLIFEVPDAKISDDERLERILIPNACFIVASGLLI